MFVSRIWNEEAKSILIFPFFLEGEVQDCVYDASFKDLTLDIKPAKKRVNVLEFPFYFFSLNLPFVPTRILIW